MLILADDIFALGWVMYSIMADDKPYNSMDDEKVERHFEGVGFSPTVDLTCVATIDGCWNGCFTVVAGYTGTGLRDEVIFIVTFRDLVFANRSETL